MNCPKCGEVLEEGMRFCTKCGANIEQVTKELEEQKRKEEIEKAQQEEIKKEAEKEEQKKAEEENSQENLKKEAERLENEKKKLEEEKRKLEEEKLRTIREAEQLKQIKAENEEKERMAAENAKKALEVSKTENVPEFATDMPQHQQQQPVNQEAEFKPAKKQKEKRKRKNFLRRFFDRLILIIVIAAIFIGGIYYLNIKGYLPEVISKEINSLIEQIKDVRSGINQEYKNETSKKSEENKTDEEKTEENSVWAIENTIEAENIINLDKEVSAIVKDGKYGIVDNETGKVLLDIKYESIYINPAGDIVVSSDGKEYGVDSKYQLAEEMPEVVYNIEILEYVYVENDEKVYFYDSSSSTLKEADKLESHSSDIIVYEEATINEDDISIVNSEKHVQYEAINHIGKFGVYSTKEKKRLTENIYQNIFNYSEGLAAAKKDDIAGFLNENGEEINFEYEETRNVYNGLAWAKKDGKWGIIKIEE